MLDVQLSSFQDERVHRHRRHRRLRRHQQHYLLVDTMRLSKTKYAVQVCGLPCLLGLRVQICLVMTSSRTFG